MNVTISQVSTDRTTVIVQVDTRNRIVLNFDRTYPEPMKPGLRHLRVASRWLRRPSERHGWHTDAATSFPTGYAILNLNTGEQVIEHDPV